MIRVLTLLFALTLVSGAAATAAHADPPGKKKQVRVAQADAVKCTVRCIRAHQGAGGIDKRLAFMRKLLARPPFSAFKSFELLTVKALVIPRSQTREAPLPTKKTVSLTFKDKLVRGTKVKLHLRLAIKPKLNTVFKISDGGTMLVAGAKHRGGKLVVGITCAAK